MIPLKALGLVFQLAAKLIPATKALIDATKKDSPGGKKITRGEYRAIGEQLAPLLAEFAEQLDADGQ